jgi:hypothetical protein
LELFLLQKNLKFFLEEQLGVFLVLFLFFILFIYLESASLKICSYGSYIYYSGFYSSSFGKQSNFGESSTIEMEVNMNEETLHFFINKTQLPCVVHNITSPSISFGISGIYTELTVELLSLIKLNKPSSNIQNCTKFDWEEKVEEEEKKKEDDYDDDDDD